MLRMSTQLDPRLGPGESLQCKMSWPAKDSLDLEGVAAAAEECTEAAAEAAPVQDKDSG